MPTLSLSGMNFRPAHDMKIIAPSNSKEFAQYYDLRWRMLRAPWNQPRGSEKDELEDAGFHVMACDAENNIVGVGRLHAASATQGQIRYMAVAEAQRGKGIGGIILNELERLARQQHLTSIVLHARENALPFYLKHDYSQVEKSHLLFNCIQHFKMLKHL